MLTAVPRAVKFQGLLLREREGNVYRSKKGEEDRVG